MISSLWNKSSIFHPVESLNNLIGIAGIGGKILLEKLNLADTNSFTTYGEFEKLPENDKNILKKRLNELE